MRALSTCPLLGAREGVSFHLSAERNSNTFFFLSKCLAFTAIFLICYVFPRIAKGILFFPPSAHTIINSSSILLCCLHVRPYLPLNTLSPINIFQISYTVSEYKSGSPCSCLLCVVSSPGGLHSLNFVL